MSDGRLLSVLTPSTRPDGLPMVAECLARQTVPIAQIEWLVCVPPTTQAPTDLVAHLKALVPSLRFLADPPRRPGDFYRLNGAFNALVREARSDLLVFAVDWIWFEPNALAGFLDAHRQNSLVCISSAGNHYRKVVGGRPEVLWECDPRPQWVADLPGSEGYRMSPEWNELSLASLPRHKVIEAGGFDEDYDRGAGLSEKELSWRLSKAGCDFHLTEVVPHRIFTHQKEQPSAAWDAAFEVAYVIFDRHRKEVHAGTRLKIEPSASLTGATP